MKLRAYQTRTVTEVLQALRNGARGVLIQAPCGAGKTEIAIELARQLNKRWTVVVPNSILATQTERRLRECGLPAVRYGIADEAVSQAERINVATIQMLLERDAEKKLRPDYICFDEAHHYEAEAWADFAARYPEALRIGMTATPERFDGKSLLRHFDHLVIGATYAELIAAGVLVSARIYAPAVSAPRGLAMDPLEAWRRFSEGRRTILACGFIKEAQRYAEKFNRHFGAFGVRAACVDGDTPRSLNYAVLDDFREGKIQVLTNVYYVAEGFDLPEIGCVVFARRFEFRGTYVQFGGRALRAAPNKLDAIGIDLTGCSRHGHIHGDYPWTIAEQDKPGRQNRTGDGEGDGRERKPLGVTNEGLVRVAHGALGPSDPDPAPVVSSKQMRQRTASKRLLDEWGRIEQNARKMAGAKGAAAARFWAEREKKRCIRLSPPTL